MLTSGNVTSKGQPQVNKQDDDLVERAVTDADLNARLAALRRLAQIKGERGALSLTEVYQRTEDIQIKKAVIRSLSERGEMMPLSAIRQIEKEKELRELIGDEITDVINRQQQAFREQNPHLPPPPPPPPPPIRASLPTKDYDFQIIGSEGRNLLKPILFSLDSTRLTRMIRLKLPHFSISSPELVSQDGAYYLLDRFEIELEGNIKLYGVGTLRIQPKKDSIEYSLTSDGGIYLDATYTQKVGLSEFLK